MSSGDQRTPNQGSPAVQTLAAMCANKKNPPVDSESASDFERCGHCFYRFFCVSTIILQYIYIYIHLQLN